MTRQSELDPAEIGRLKREIAIIEGRGCARCGNTIGVLLEDSRTMYLFDGELGSSDDPNKPIPFCRPCASDHHAYWDDVWNDYHRGLL